MKNDSNAVVQALEKDANTAHITYNWFIPFYTPIFPQQTLLREHIISRALTIVILRTICWRKICGCTVQLVFDL